MQTSSFAHAHMNIELMGVNRRLLKRGRLMYMGET